MSCHVRWRADACCDVTSRLLRGHAPPLCSHLLCFLVRSSSRCRVRSRRCIRRIWRATTWRRRWRWPCFFAAASPTRYCDHLLSLASFSLGFLFVAMPCLSACARCRAERLMVALAECARFELRASLSAYYLLSSADPISGRPFIIGPRLVDVSQKAMGLPDAKLQFHFEPRCV